MASYTMGTPMPSAATGPGFSVPPMSYQDTMQGFALSPVPTSTAAYEGNVLPLQFSQFVSKHPLQSVAYDPQQVPPQAQAYAPSQGQTWIAGPDRAAALRDRPLPQPLDPALSDQYTEYEDDEDPDLGPENREPPAGGTPATSTKPGYYYRQPELADFDGSMLVLIVGMCCIPPVLLYNLLYLYSEDAKARVISRVSQLIFIFYALTFFIIIIVVTSVDGW